MGAFLNDADSSLEIDTRDPVAQMKLSAAVSERRASLLKYVSAAIALAVLLCAAAVVKVAVARTEKAQPSPVWVLPPVAATIPDAPEPTGVTASPPRPMAGASAPVTPPDPKGAAKASKEKAKWRPKTGVDRAANSAQ